MTAVFHPLVTGKRVLCILRVTTSKLNLIKQKYLKASLHISINTSLLFSFKEPLRNKIGISDHILENSHNQKADSEV